MSFNGIDPSSLPEALIRDTMNTLPTHIVNSNPDSLNSKTNIIMYYWACVYLVTIYIYTHDFYNDIICIVYYSLLASGRTVYIHLLT